MKRDILNHLGEVVGELELPDDTAEEVWSERLDIYRVPPPSIEAIMDRALNASIKDRKEWADGMLERFKKRNILLGINGAQALWLHHRMRALEINFMGIPMTQDILNMAVSGDIETACLSLLYSTLDDGSMPYHWYNEATRNWLVSEMKSYLGWP